MAELNLMHPNCFYFKKLVSENDENHVDNEIDKF